MLTSLYSIAEQCRLITDNRVSIQALTTSVKNAYAQIAKKYWFEGTQFDDQNLDGSFLYTFNSVVPILDCDRDMYYIVMPSSYLVLPHEIGINWVSYMKDRTSFVRVQNWGIFSQLQSAVMGGREAYDIEGNKMWFPKMTSDNTGPILLKLAIALDAVEPEEELNIAPNIVQEIIMLVVSPYMQTENAPERTGDVIN
jgi:hypothetical protein